MRFRRTGFARLICDMFESLDAPRAQQKPRAFSAERPRRCRAKPA
jgi:hypothetical protein